MQNDYQLIVIEQEKVPLAANPDITNNNFWLTLAVVLTIVVLISLWFYLMRCIGYRKRIRELDPGGGEYRGWSVIRLEQTVKDLEFSLAEI